MTGDFSASIRTLDARLFTKNGNQRLVDVLPPKSVAPKHEKAVGLFPRLFVEAGRLGGAFSLPSFYRLPHHLVHRLDEGMTGFIHGHIKVANWFGRIRGWAPLFPSTSNPQAHDFVHT